MELVEEGEVVRDVQQAGGLGDDQLVRIGQRHLVLRIPQSERTVEMSNYYNIVFWSFIVDPISTVVLVLLKIYSSRALELLPPLYLYGVIGRGDLRMDAQLLYDSSRPTLLHPHHQDVREPHTDLTEI